MAWRVDPPTARGRCSIAPTLPVRPPVFLMTSSTACILIRRPVALLAALLAAASSCGTPPPPEVALPAPKTAAPPALDANQERCARLEKRAVDLAAGLRADADRGAPGSAARESHLRQAPTWCARALLEKTRAECPGPLADATSLEGSPPDSAERRETARFRVSADGRWIVEWAGVHHVVRVWEASPDALRLAWLLAPAEDCSPIDGPPAGRIACHVRFEQRRNGDGLQYFLVLDSATGTVRRFDDVEGWQRRGPHLVLASYKRVRRLDWATLEITADVPRPAVDFGFPFKPEILAGGRTVLLDDTLVSMETGAALAEKIAETGYLAGMAISEDRSRLLACTSGKPVIVDAATGRQQPISGKHTCGIGMAFTPDGRRAVGADETAGPARSWGASDRTLTPFVVDLATGAARTVAAASFRIARRGQWSRVALPSGGQGRVCLSYSQDAGKGVLLHGDDNEGDVCPWQLAPSGALSLARKPPRPDPLSAASKGLQGAATPDLAAGTLSQVEGEHLGAGWALAPDHRALIDLATSRRFALDPDEAAWRAVKTHGARCPERLEDEGR